MPSGSGSQASLESSRAHVFLSSGESLVGRTDVAFRLVPLAFNLRSGSNLNELVQSFRDAG